MGRVALHLPGASGGGGATPSGRLLSSLSEGTIMMLDENGVGKKFIFLQHNHYGKNECTLLRKDTFAPRQWTGSFDGSANNCYNGCDMDMFCNTQYKIMLDPVVRDCLVNVPLPTAIGSVYTTQPSPTVVNLARSCFILSAREATGTINWASEGSAFQFLTIQANRIACYDETGTRVDWWLRSPYSQNSLADTVNSRGELGYTLLHDALYICPRPALTLPANVLVSSSPDGSGSFYVVGIPKHGGGYYVRDPEGYWV